MQHEWFGSERLVYPLGRGGGGQTVGPSRLGLVGVWEVALVEVVLAALSWRRNRPLDTLHCASTGHKRLLT